MAKELKQLAVANPSANTNTLIYTATATGIVVANMVVVNEDMTDLRFNILISNTLKEIYVAKSQILLGRSTFESPKFSLEADDEVYVQSTSEYASFILTGIDQTEI